MPRPSTVVELVQDHVVVALAGEVDLAIRSDLLNTYDHAIALQPVPHLVVDLSRVTFMDSTGLGTLVAAQKKVKARSGTLSVVGASDRIVELLHTTRLDTIITVLPATAVALEA